jgi:4-hydroxybenzoate polyprenyltransferase
MLKRSESLIARGGREKHRSQAPLLIPEAGNSMASTALRSSTVWSTLRGLFKTMRPQQWIKNVVVFAALVFDGKLLQPAPFGRTLLMLLCFCLASSAVYLLNDWVDMEKDRQHPIKRLRPLPSGALHPHIALVAAVLLAAVSLLLSTWLGIWAGGITLAYLLQNVAYSFFLKNIVVIDVMVIALGFLLRVLAGAVVVDVTRFSPWLYVCMTSLALFLGFGKRRHEILLLQEEAGNHRASLEQYNLLLLDQLISIVTTSTLVTYTLYGIEAETAIVGGGRMLLTVPFVFYFIARYLYLIHVRKLGGAPEELLLKDKPSLINAVLWAIAVVILIYIG